MKTTKLEKKILLYQNVPNALTKNVDKTLIMFQIKNVDKTLIMFQIKNVHKTLIIPIKNVDKKPGLEIKSFDVLNIFGKFRCLSTIKI